MKPILLATDGSPSAEAATLRAIELARTFGAPLVVASVAQADLHAVEYEHVARTLAETQKRVVAAGGTCTTVALDGPAGVEICQAAREHSPRLIVIGAHGWGRMGRLLHGSVSTFVLHHAECPVLVVHADGPSPAAVPATAAAG